LLAAAGRADDVVADRFTLGAATLGLLTTAAEASPLLLLVDDAHWLDPTTSEAVSFAIRRLGADAVAVLAATRPRASRLVIGDQAESVELTGLGDADVLAVLADADLAVTPAVASAIVGATAGVPLAVLETARALTAEQRAGWAPLPSPLPIGREVLTAYRTRLDRLPEPTRNVVGLAALAGPIPVAALAAAATDTGACLSHLQPAEDEGVVAVGPGGVEFAHPLLRAAALRLCTAEQRRAQHRALAEASRDDPERRATHLAAAAAGPDERASAALEAAAESIARRASLAAAAPLLAQAADFSAPGERRYGRLARAARALGLAGRADEAIRAAHEVLDHAKDPTHRADAVTVIVDSSMWGSRPGDVLAFALEEARRLLADDREHALRVLAHATVCSTSCQKVSASLRVGQRAMELLTSSTPVSVRIEVESSYAALLVLSGDHVRAAELMAAWPPVDAGSPVRPPEVAQTLMRLGRYAEGEGVARALREVSNRDASPSAKAMALAVTSELRWWQGQWSVAVSLGEQAASLAEQTGQAALAWYVRAVNARVLAGLGEQRRSRLHAETALRAARSHNIGPLNIYALAALGLLELGSGDPTAAARWLVEADRVRRDLDCADPAAVPFGADLVEALLRSGQVDAARAALAEHTELAERSGLRWARATMLRCRALLTEDPEEADALFAAAVHRHPAEVSFDLARTRLYWGEHRRRHRDVAASRALLHEALTAFERLGAQPWAERAAAELRASGERPRRTRIPDLAELTPRELHCALAVAEGMTNREAAAALFLSPKTVEYHLSKAYSKLGITSRTQLARVLNAEQAG
jgi:DNA-binding CsgD family transcriptional regulator